MNPDRQRIIQIRLQREKLIVRIHDLANDGQVAFSDHALERMDERGISDVQVIRVLKVGELRGEIEPGNRPGEWKCKVVERIKGHREIGVATLIIRNSRLFVKTVEWEDLK